ncbi:hypothetical protein DFH29DRAFT_883251 [Suillus ampliporus]|nr:hypothetical protein DFH29DRAFT_883251 [Suillus ampliporus]
MDEIEPSVGAFEGDYYGVYSEDKLEWPDSDEVPEQVANSDLDDDDFLFETEWEAHLLPQAEQDHSLPDNALASDEAHDSEDIQQNAHQDVKAHVQGQGGFITGAHLADDENPYYPFASKIEWEVARWAKLHGASSTAFSDLLSIDGVSESLGLSFKNTNELNKVIDHELPTGCPKFKWEQIIIAGESFDVYYHNVIQYVQSLYGDPNFARYLTFAPECHYTNEDQTVCLFHDMHTGKWWWNTQTAYPIYLTIGNIPKEIWHKPSCGGHILLAYLPTAHLEHVTNKASCCWSIANLYHACLSHVLAPLQSAGLEGVNMCSGDGALHHRHPFFTSSVGDYPEQLLASGIKFGYHA